MGAAGVVDTAIADKSTLPDGSHGRVMHVNRR
jgi:hypothetical protein